MDAHPHIRPVPEENNEDSLVDLVWRACLYDCVDLIEFECFKHFGHDRLTHLSPDQESRLVLICRTKVARRAKNRGYRPKDWEKQP